MKNASTVQPRTLYKYVPAERALQCLPEVGDGSQRATQPAALNDPFECAIGSLFAERDETDGNQQYAEILNSLHQESHVTANEVACAREKYGSLYLRELLSKQLSKRFGIVSFSIDPSHPLLWSHYTIDGSGFVIGYDSTELLKVLVPEVKLIEVQYKQNLPKIIDYRVLNEQNVQTLLTFKSPHWCYEQEWRLIVKLADTIGKGCTDRHGLPITLIQIRNCAVSSVYYTERTPDKDVAEIRRRLAEPNNRYCAEPPTKLVMSDCTYGYVPDASPRH